LESETLNCFGTLGKLHSQLAIMRLPNVTCGNLLT
jgi:hypothetical protein